MSELNLTGESDPEDRMVDIDQQNRDRVEDALDNEREPSYDGQDSVVDDDPSTMMEHL